MNRLGAEAIKQASTLTSIRYLEIVDWKVWDSLKPLASLPKLSHLGTNLRLQFLEGMLNSASMRNLKRVSLVVRYENSQISGEKRAAHLRDRLRRLPSFRHLSVSRSDCSNDEHSIQHVLEVLGLKGLKGRKWQCLCSQERFRLYERKSTA